MKNLLQLTDLFLKKENRYNERGERYFNLVVHVFEPTLFSKYDKVPIERKVIDVTRYLDEFDNIVDINIY